MNEALGEPRPDRAPSPRALALMAAVRWALLLLVTALAAYTTWTHWGPGAEAQAPRDARPRYACPMHPQIRSPDPGECPICHMDLEPIPEERAAGAAEEHGGSHAGGHARGHAHHRAPADVTAVTIDAEAQAAIGLVTTPVESATLRDTLRVPGVIAAPEPGLAQVRVRAPGFVEQVAVQETGVKVSRGQPLAFVYSPEIHRAQEELLAALRWEGAPEGARELVAAAERGLELLGLSAEDVAEISRTRRPIRAVAVRAPAGGYVTRFNAILGSRAEPEMVLYEIADLSTVWVIASVAERDLSTVRVGARARFSSAAAPDAPITGRVALIEPVLDEATRTSRIRLVLPNGDGRLRPGQFGQVELELPASAGLRVPRDAVIRTGQHDYVYVATGSDRFEPRAVTVGATREGRAWVTSGLEEGERVVSRASFMLDSESRLQASLAQPDAPASAPADAPASAPASAPADAPASAPAGR